MSNSVSQKKGGGLDTVRTVMAATGSEESQKKLQELQQKVESTPFNAVEHLDKKRAYIAQLFVWGFLALIFMVLLGVPLFNKWVGSTQPIDLDKTLAQVSGLLGTPLGFVVGYYFKENKRR